MGPSGSGKSTLLRMINHLEHMSGASLVGGKHVGYRLARAVCVRPATLPERGPTRASAWFPAFQSVRSSDRAGERDRSADQVYREDPETARRKAMGLLTMVGLAHHPIICRIGFPAASSSASRLRARSPFRRA